MGPVRPASGRVLGPNPEQRRAKSDTTRTKKDGAYYAAVRKFLERMSGVGPGFLDTLDAFRGKPILYDTATTIPEIGGQSFPNYRGDTARVVINPKSRYTPAGTLAHEVGGHLTFGAGGDRWGERQAEDVAQSILRNTDREVTMAHETGRNDFLTTTNIDRRVRQMLDRLGIKPIE